MGWGILLSKYQRSILKDKWPVLLMSILERYGITTEAEIANVLKIDTFKLNDILLTLHKDDLITYGRATIKLTETGKALLERLDLHKHIIDDLLSSLDMQDNDRAAYYTLLHAYRSDSYDLYQNTLTSIKVWNNLFQEAKISDSRESYFYERKKYTLLILNRDLGNWYKYRGNISSLLSNHIFSIFKVKIEDFSSTATDLKKLFITFNKFQASYEPDEWYEIWRDKIQPIKFQKNYKYVNYLKTLNDFIGNYVNANVKAIDANHILTKNLVANWFIKSSKKYPNNLLEEIMLARDLDDLHERLRFPKNTLISILKEISGVCNKLLTNNKGNETK